MNNMIVDGRALADSIATDAVAILSQCPHVPQMGILAIAPTKETQSFLRIKKKWAERLGISVYEEIHDTLSQEEALVCMQKLVDSCDGVVLQKPLPKYINEQELLALLPKEKDIDGLTKSSTHISPVALAVETVLHAHTIPIRDKKVVVVGEGKLVGIPVANLLKEKGAHVTIFNEETGIDVARMQEADIIVSGVGKPGIITADMVGAHTVLIDAGTSESQGTIQGDVDKACYEKVRLISPVPGGIGPITVVELFKNLMKSASCPL